MITPDDIEIIVATDLGRDVIAAEVEVAGEIWAEVVADDPGFSVTFFPREDGSFFTLPFGIAVDALAHARRRLERLGYTQDRPRSSPADGDSSPGG